MHLFMRSLTKQKKVKGYSMIRKLNIQHIEQDKELWLELLFQEGIKSEDNIDETYGLFDENQLVATASRYQNVIKCVAVDSEVQGGAYFNQIISHLMNRNTDFGHFKHYVYTKPDTQEAFEYLGFQTIEQVENKLVFMENAISGFDVFLEQLKAHRIENEQIAAIVMNANPFTLGHQYLVENAAAENDHVFIFVLSEEMSVFTASIRKSLVEQGVGHLKNVTVLSTENYMVSNATFPSYFLKEDDDLTAIQARLDARLFANHIAPALNITTRYVGNEPHSEATNIYNQALQQEFEGKLALKILERKENQLDVISATKVRNLLIEDDLKTVRYFVPETTLNFLQSDEGQEIINQLKDKTI